MPYGSKSVVSDTNAAVTDSIWDVPGVGAVPQEVPSVAQAVGQNIATWAASPHDVMQVQQPQVAGQWSDVDEAIRQMNLAQQYQWGPETAMIMMGLGGAPPEASAAMGRPSIEYLNARRAAKPAGGGKTYARGAKQAPDVEAMTPEELTAALSESAWREQSIAQEAYWDKLFEQFGLTRGYGLEDTFGSGSRQLGKVIFAEEGGQVFKRQPKGRWPTYTAQKATGETQEFRSEDKAVEWLGTKIPAQRPEPPASPMELPPWEEPIKAYHGSPHDFPAFSMEKVGTGEGAQSYGHGLYFAENPQVAAEYRKALTQAQIDKEGFAKGYPGKTYEVNINADPEHFLDWDKPLSEQSPKVQETLQKVLPGYEESQFISRSGRNAYEEFARGRGSNPLVDLALGTPTRPGIDHAAASRELREAGIPGIKYLDQGSRNAQVVFSENSEGGHYFVGNSNKPYATRAEADAAAAKLGPTHNYVVFDDKLIDIVKKYGIAGLIGAGASNWSPGKAEASEEQQGREEPPLYRGGQAVKRSAPAGRNPLQPTPEGGPKNIHGDVQQPMKMAGEAGQVAPGNIDLHNRPVVKNPDGSISTVRSITITDDQGRGILIPTVVGNKVVSDKEAVKEYQRTGQHLGIFSSEKAANAYANKLHKEQAKEYLK